jgi:hypothetical protein
MSYSRSFAWVGIVWALLLFCREPVLAFIPGTDQDLMNASSGVVVLEIHSSRGAGIVRSRLAPGYSIGSMVSCCVYEFAWGVARFSCGVRTSCATFIRVTDLLCVIGFWKTAVFAPHRYGITCQLIGDFISFGPNRAMQRTAPRSDA